ncbi:hypothetical protein [Celeribacter ethanolicus]|uniref:hypothetical protein n=1 Tax=Celeribacter ethanolicus TaxID=1758178 RepID=UPI00082BC741|nr:hypothetical protein [Celeribacter ethanolicus]TNE64913.1 MAG: hypothetical protein EP336_14000 [Paracoccaceae bacterium]
MKVTSSVGDEFETVDQIEASVKQSLLWAILALDDVIDRLLTGEKAGGKEVKPLIADLMRAKLAAVTERQKLDDEKRKRGELGGGEIDFDAARSEILDRLARLKAASRAE